MAPSRTIPLLFILLLSGCAALKPAPPQPLAPEAARGISPDSIKAEGVIEITNGSALSGRALILAMRPDYLRIEVLGPLGGAVFLLVGEGETISTFSDGKIEKSRVGEPAYPYPFSPGEAVSVLLGAAENGGGMRPEEASSGDDGWAQEGMLRVRLGSRGAFALVGDFREVSGFTVPGSIIIENGAARISLRYTSIQPNPGVERSDFIAPGED